MEQRIPCDALGPYPLVDARIPREAQAVFGGFEQLTEQGQEATRLAQRRLEPLFPRTVLGTSMCAEAKCLTELTESPFSLSSLSGLVRMGPMKIETGEVFLPFKRSRTENETGLFWAFWSPSQPPNPCTKTLQEYHRLETRLQGPSHVDGENSYHSARTVGGCR